MLARAFGSFMVSLLLASPSGCSRHEARPTEPKASVSVPESATSSLSDETICLSPPSGRTVVDVQLTRQMDTARALPGKADAWLHLAQGWVRKSRLASDPGFYLNAKSCAAIALRVSPDLADASNVEALVLMNGHRFSEARTLANQILAKSPDDPVALGTLSDALLELGDVDAAARAAQRLVNVKPGMASYSRASYFRWIDGDAKGAKELVTLALKAGRDTREAEGTAWTFVQAGTLFWNEADFEGADAIFVEALRYLPDYPPALVARARIALARGDGRRAIELLEPAYDRQPLPETAWLLGDARAMTGDAPGAALEWARVVREGHRVDPLTLAHYYATKGLEKDAALALVEEERRTRGGVHVDDIYAWVLYRLGRFAEAKVASDHARRFGTNEARLLYHAGAIRIAMGEVAVGRTLVERALALNPKFDVTGAMEARSLLASHAHDAPSD
jgi:tetratricopeptide (TPR) repeat protein